MTPMMSWLSDRSWVLLALLLLFLTVALTVATWRQASGGPGLAVARSVDSHSAE